MTTIKKNVELTAEQLCLVEMHRTRRGDLNRQRQCLVDDWARRQKLRPSGRRKWWGLLGKRDQGKLPYTLPGDDHVMEFASRRRLAVHVAQPYDLNTATTAKMVAAADLYGLQYAILDDEAGWWYPGKTHFIIWTRQGDAILQQILERAS